MIHPNKKILYIHPPRNGGKSIESIFWKLAPVRGSSGHETIREVMTNGIDFEEEINKKINIKLNSKDLKNYYCFMFCRNPWDRLVSFYHHMIQDWNSNYLKPFEKWIKGKNRRGADYKRCLLPQSQLHFITLNYPSKKLKRFRDKNRGGAGIMYQNINDDKLSRRMLNTEYFTEYNNKLILNLSFLGRFENYKSDYNTLCNNLQKHNSQLHKRLNSMSLPHHNKSTHNDYREYYDDESIELVSEIYADDIDFFGYSFDNKNNKGK